MAFLDLSGLEIFKGKLDEIYGATLQVSGTTVKLVSKSGVQIGSATLVIPEYDDATSTTSGLMSGTDKGKLDGIATGATKTAKSGSNGSVLINGTQVVVYTHPSHQAQDSGLYKITVDGSGHVTAVSAVTKQDITELGIPSQDTTYTTATSSKAGLMSTGDKQKLDGMAAGAQPNILESVSINGTQLPISSKGVNIDLSGYATKDMVSSAVRYMGSVTSWAELPTSAENGHMYNVETASPENNCPAGGNVVWSADRNVWDVQGPSVTVEAITIAEINALF